MSSFLLACQALVLFIVISYAKCRPPQERLCPEGWATYAGSLSPDGSRKCYKVVDWNVDKEEAGLRIQSLKSTCAAIAGQPVSIHNIVENDFVTHLVRNSIADVLTARCQNDVDDNNCTAPVFARLGCDTPHDGSNAWWVDGSDLDFTNYAIGVWTPEDGPAAGTTFYGNCFLNANPRFARREGPLVFYGQWVGSLKGSVDWTAPIGVCQLVVES